MDTLVAIHARFYHVEQFAKVLGGQTCARLHAVASPVKDVRVVPQCDVSFRVIVYEEHAWLVETISIRYNC